MFETPTLIVVETRTKEKWSQLLNLDEIYIFSDMKEISNSSSVFLLKNLDTPLREHIRDLSIVNQLTDAKTSRSHQ